MTTPITRRAALAGITWATPSVIVSTAAPAIAASVPELEGLLRITHSQSLLRSTLEVTTDAPGLGLHLSHRTAPSTARLELHLSASVVPATTRWSPLGPWTSPRRLRTENGFTVWESTYTGTWAERDGVWRAEPFTWTAPVGRTQLQARVIRTAAVEGEDYTADSGVVTLSPGRAARSASTDGTKTEAQL